MKTLKGLETRLSRLLKVGLLIEHLKGIYFFGYCRGTAFHVDQQLEQFFLLESYKIIYFQS